MDTNRKVTVEFNEYDHTCADGCCNSWGFEVRVNGVELDAQNLDVQTQVRQILEHLGYEVEIINKYNGEEY